MNLIYGVGINDVDYVVQQFEFFGYIGGKQQRKLIWMCPFYSTWKDMLTRGYSSKYKDCFVNEEWHLLSNFKSWMEQQKWKDRDGSNKLQLDKDILVQGNKEYSKDKCIFVPQYINLFLLDSRAKRGGWPLGVCWHKRDEKFRAQGSDGKGRRIDLGSFTDPNEAHIAWKSHKHSLALQYADELEQEGYDSRLIEALRVRYL